MLYSFEHTKTQSVGGIVLHCIGAAICFICTVCADGKLEYG